MNREQEEPKKHNAIFIITKYKKFKCQHCIKVFKERSNLITHTKIHTGEKKFTCKFEGCLKRFITLGNLKAHQDFHSKYKPYACQEYNCTERYSKQSRLIIHIRTHTGELPYKCYCGKSFNERGNLKTHTRIHTGERPFVCKFEGCNAAFKAHGHLKDHKKMHTKERPYLCKVCGKGFGRSGILKNHMRIHQRAKLNSKTTNQESVDTPKSSGISDDKLKLNENDGEITISCVSNLNEEGTPINKQALLNSYNSKIKVTSFSYEINKKVTLNIPTNSLFAINNSTELGNEIKENKLIHHQLLTLINQNNSDETPTKTPISKIQSKIQNCVDNGIKTFNNDQLVSIRNFYLECLNHYLNIYRNDIKYVKFTDLLNFLIQNETKNGNELTPVILLDYLEKLRNQVGISEQMIPPKVGNSPLSINNYNSSVNNNFELGNLSNFISPKNNNNLPGQYLLESPIYYNTNCSTFSPITLNYFSKSNNNNNVNHSQGNESFNVPRNVNQQKSTFVNFSCLADNYKNQ